MTTKAFETLREEARKAHLSIPAIAEFCSFPTDLAKSEYSAFHIRAADLLARDPALQGEIHPLARAFVNAGPDAQWRETYKGTEIGSTFMDKFACYCLIGRGGPWISQTMAGYVVYMPKGLYYPWHHHPAEELYYVLAGEAEFFREGQPSAVLGAGDASFHASNQPHAMETKESSVLAYVAWRSELDTPPVLTEREV